MPSEPKCPVCDAPRARKYRPFCSRRCADVDLGRWFTGVYAIPTEEVPEDIDSILARPDDEDDGY